jgi:cystinosin
MSVEDGAAGPGSGRWRAAALALVAVCACAALTAAYAERRSGPDGGKTGVWRAVSWLIGWLYFAAWSLSFYPQLVLNHRRRSTEGLSYNFVWLNLLGFGCYSVFNLALFCSSSVQESYKRAHGGKTSLVRANDVFFAVHATSVTGATLVQMYCFGFKRSPGRQVWFSVLAFIAIALLIAGGYLVGVLAHGDPEWDVSGGSNFWNMLSWLYFVSYIKLCISFFKYLPQVWLNYTLKSTRGWSLINVCLDLTGGLLSFLQLFIDASLDGDWKGSFGDPVKLGLSLLSLLFDAIFLVQHYVLYKDAPDHNVSEDDELLAGRDDEPLYQREEHTH